MQRPLLPRPHVSDHNAQADLRSGCRDAAAALPVPIGALAATATLWTGSPSSDATAYLCRFPAGVFDSVNGERCGDDTDALSVCCSVIRACLQLDERKRRVRQKILVE